MFLWVSYYAYKQLHFKLWVQHEVINNMIVKNSYFGFNKVIYGPSWLDGSGVEPLQSNGLLCYVMLKKISISGFEFYISIAFKWDTEPNYQIFGGFST